MDIKNLNKVNKLACEMKELEMCRNLLLGGGYIKVCGNDADTFGEIKDRTVREALLFAVIERQKTIKKYLNYERTGNRNI